MENKELEEKLRKELFQACLEAKKKKVNPILYMEMLALNGPIEASKKVVNKEKATKGYTDLLLIGRKDLTVEYIITQPIYKELFDEITLQNARKRLGQI
jgi:3'-phosphoadenosine 5'-phosphosulfate sulfotransferase